MRLDMLAKEFIFDCQVRNLSPRTVRNYEKQLSYFVRYMAEAHNLDELEDLKPVHIKKYVVMLQERKCKASYVNDLLKAVKVMCGYAFQEGYTLELITKRVKYTKELRVLIHTFSDDEIVKMIQYYDGTDYLSVRNRLMIMMLFDTGMRVSEMRCIEFM